MTGSPHDNNADVDAESFGSFLIVLSALGSILMESIIGGASSRSPSSADEASIICEIPSISKSAPSCVGDAKSRSYLSSAVPTDSSADVELIPSCDVEADIFLNEDVSESVEGFASRSMARVRFASGLFFSEPLSCR